MLRKSLVATLLSLPILVASAYAGPIYTVNRTIGAGSVVGTIQTDSTTGPLAAVNLLDWDLTLNAGTGPFTLFGPLSGSNSSVQIGGTSFTASPTTLLFDFANSDPSVFVFFLHIVAGGAFNYWCLEGTGAACTSNASRETVVISGPSTFVSAVSDPYSGNVTIAERDLAPVPEPTTLLLFGTTATGLALARWRARRRRHEVRAQTAL